MSYRTVTLSLLLIAGCGTAISTTVINPAPHPMSARPPETVEIFSSGAPSRPHVDVAFLEAEQRSDLSADNTPEFINRLRARAAEMGCDGVVLGGVTHSSDTALSVAADVNASKKGLTATCIMYQDGPGPEMAPPGFAPPPPPGNPPAPTAAAN